MKAYKRLLIFIGISVMFIGCAQKIEIQVLAPAQVSQIASAKRIAVVPFKHDRVGLSGRIESLIANQRVGGKIYFTLLSRKNLKRIIAEQKLQSSELINANTAIKVGELIGAQALITGSMGVQNATSRRYFKNKRECLNFSKKSGRCILWRFYRVTCFTTKATISANINIVNIETGSIIYGDTLSKNYNGDTCHNGGINLGLLSFSLGTTRVLSREQALNMLASQIAHEFVSKLVPHYVHFKVKLLDDIKIKITSKQENILKNALLFIKVNRLNKAKKMLEQLMFELHGKSYIVAYDLGVVDEALGKLDKAKELYVVADNLTQTPVEPLDEAINRINKLIIKRNLAMSQLNAK